MIALSVRPLRTADQRGWVLGGWAFHGGRRTDHHRLLQARGRQARGHHIPGSNPGARFD